MCRAIIASSSVVITQTPTALSGELIIPLPAWLRTWSNSTPSQESGELMALRALLSFSPMPPVNTSASKPPSAAASEPISRTIR